MKQVFVAFALLLAAAGASSIKTSYGTVYVSSAGHYRFVAGTADKAGVAYGSFQDPDAHVTSNFGQLHVATNASFPDEQQMYAAGFLEGALTQTRIFEYVQDMSNWTLNITPGTGVPPALTKWFDSQDAWMREQVSSQKDDPLWQQMGLILAQFDGIQAGYNATAPSDQAVGQFGFRIINGMGDMLTLFNVLFPSTVPRWERMAPDDMESTIALSGHCSGFIKVTGNFSDLFAAHSSWFTYQNMIRVFKHYKLNIANPSTAAHAISFSSYPGMLVSLDDFYMMDSGLVMVQTTNGIYNKTLFSLVKPESLLAWHRVRLANAMAKTGEQWGATLERYNSGTYPNQYMILNYGQFTPGQGLLPGSLVVVEQIPGLVVYADQTQQLMRGYWPSYNVPFYRSIYNTSGYPQMIEAYDHLRTSTGASPVSALKYQTAPRANIFRRDQDNVTDMSSLRYLMRYNDYKHDPYAQGSPYGAICSRGDLAANPNDGGCYDSKVTNLAGMKSLTAWAVNGPTHQGLPPFNWDQFPHVLHTGQAQVFDFDFEEYSADWQHWDSQL
eukprot:PLAT5104.1.p1 GENE.PLAT5104.1~~PLAT5104.1.p1  ORF type:complete len:554 (+),score=259.67 PLAT5104.1:12-1673(+)